MNLSFRDIIERHLFLVYVLIACLLYANKGFSSIWEFNRSVEFLGVAYDLGAWDLEWYLLGFLLLGYGLIWLVGWETIYWVSVLQVVLVIYVCFVGEYAYKKSYLVHLLCVILYAANLLLFFMPYLTRQRHIPGDDLLDDNKGRF